MTLSTAATIPNHSVKNVEEFQVQSASEHWTTFFVKWHLQTMLAQSIWPSPLVFNLQIISSHGQDVWVPNVDKHKASKGDKTYFLYNYYSMTILVQ